MRREAADLVAGQVEHVHRARLRAEREPRIQHVLENSQESKMVATISDTLSKKIAAQSAQIELISQRLIWALRGFDAGARGGDCRAEGPGCRAERGSAATSESTESKSVRHFLTLCRVNKTLLDST